MLRVESASSTQKPNTPSLIQQRLDAHFFFSDQDGDADRTEWCKALRAWGLEVDGCVSFL
jgi:hypothetical protein